MRWCGPAMWKLTTSLFPASLCSYYEDKYRLHNWVYKRQHTAQQNRRKNLQHGDVILEFDYAAKAGQFQQDCMPCSASGQTSKFIVYAHFDPKLDLVGNWTSLVTTSVTPLRCSRFTVTVWYRTAKASGDVSHTFVRISSNGDSYKILHVSGPTDLVPKTKVESCSEI